MLVVIRGQEQISLSGHICVIEKIQQMVCFGGVELINGI